MIPFPQRGWRPSAQQLAAYADGELDPSERERIEEWLVGHPEGMAEVEAHWRFARLWTDAQPPDPTDLDWLEAEERVRQRRRLRRAPASPFSRPMKAMASVAAVIAVVILFASRPAPRRPSPTVPTSAEEYPILSPSDVEIISIDPADQGALLVREQSLEEPIIPASRNELTVNRVHPDRQGHMPRIHSPSDGPSVTLVVAPLLSRRP